jgi:flagellar assembly factor FliW
MPFLETKNLGRIVYEAESAIEFPWGLPGFEGRRKFVIVRFAHTGPLLFLQSLEDPALSFVTLPAKTADPQYQLKASEDDLRRLGLPTSRQPRIGEDVHCLVVLTLRESGPTANLLAPVIINLSAMKAVQAVAPESSYSHQHALMPEMGAPCS